MVFECNAALASHSHPELPFTSPHPPQQFSSISMTDSTPMDLALRTPSEGASYFAGAHDFTIGTQTNNSVQNNITVVNNTSADLIRDLNPVRNASHIRDRKRFPPDSQCLPGTRKKLIEQIQNWVNSGILFKSMPSHILWLYGYVGCGKSAIAQTVAENFAKNGRLAASFFFFRATADRSGSSRFAGTLASQLATSVPSARPFIEIAHASIGDELRNSTVALQFQHLFLEPFYSAFQSPGRMIKGLISGPYLTVIDGLDECEDQDDVAGLVEGIIEFFKDKPRAPLRFFISSRVEEHIRTRLQDPESNVELMDLVAHTSEDDIAFLVEESFKNAAKHNRVLQSYGDWPDRLTKARLVMNADNSFIVISTMLKFILEPTTDGSTPKTRLESVLDTEFGLDELYHNVFSRSKTIDHFQIIITTIALLWAPLSTKHLAEVLYIDLSDVINVLVNLHSIIHVPGDDISPVTVFHSSLSEFLCTESRAGPFFASPYHHKYLAQEFFKKMGPLGDRTSIRRQAREGFRYHWERSLALYNDDVQEVRRELRDLIVMVREEAPIFRGVLHDSVATYTLMDHDWIDILSPHPRKCSTPNFVARFVGIQPRGKHWLEVETIISAIGKAYRALKKLGVSRPSEEFAEIWDAIDSPTPIPKIAPHHAPTVIHCMQHLFIHSKGGDGAKITLLPLQDEMKPGVQFKADMSVYDYAFYSFGFHLAMAFKHDPDNVDLQFLTRPRTHVETSGNRINIKTMDYFACQRRYFDSRLLPTYLLPFRANFNMVNSAIESILSPPYPSASLVDDWGFTSTPGHFGRPNFWVLTCSKADFSVLNLWTGYSLLARCYISILEGTHEDDTCALHCKYNAAIGETT